MSSKKLSEKKLLNFHEVWLRVVENTSIRKNKDLADIVGIPESVISTRKKKNEFPVEWGFFVAQEFNLSTDWLLTGIGERRVEKKDFLGEVQEWLNCISQKDKDFYVWFKIEFKRHFPEFEEWLKKKC